MQISVSSTLTIYHDGQFWVGLAEHVENGRYGAVRRRDSAICYEQMGEADVLRQRADRGKQAHKESQAARS